MRREGKAACSPSSPCPQRGSLRCSLSFCLCVFLRRLASIVLFPSLHSSVPLRVVALSVCVCVRARLLAWLLSRFVVRSSSSPANRGCSGVVAAAAGSVSCTAWGAAEWRSGGLMSGVLREVSRGSVTRGDLVSVDDPAAPTALRVA